MPIMVAVEYIRDFSLIVKYIVSSKLNSVMASRLGDWMLQQYCDLFFKLKLIVQREHFIKKT